MTDKEILAKAIDKAIAFDSVSKVTYKTDNGNAALLNQLNEYINNAEVIIK